jgi:hypothetical protein
MATITLRVVAPQGGGRVAEPTKDNQAFDSESTRMFSMTVIFIISLVLYVFHQPMISLFGMLVFAIMLNSYMRDTVRDPREAAFLKLVDRLPERCTIVRKVALYANGAEPTKQGGKAEGKAEAKAKPRKSKPLTAEVVVTASGVLLLVADDHKGVITIRDHVWQSEVGKRKTYLDNPIDEANARQKALRSLLNRLDIGQSVPVRTYVVFTDPQAQLRVPAEQNSISVRSLDALGDELQRPMSGKLTDEQVAQVADALRATRPEKRGWLKRPNQKGK